jgi:hypothetical protein
MATVGEGATFNEADWGQLGQVSPSAHTGAHNA